MKADGAQKTRRVVIGLALVVVFALLAKWMSPAEEVPAVADRSPPHSMRSRLLTDCMAEDSHAYRWKFACSKLKLRQTITSD